MSTTLKSHFYQVELITKYNLAKASVAVMLELIKKSQLFYVLWN